MRCLTPVPGVVIYDDYYLLRLTEEVVVHEVLTIPGSHQIQSGTEAVISLPFNESSVRQLYKKGFPVRGIEPFHYLYELPLVEGSYKAMEHQKDSAAFMATHPRCYNTSTMRTGKTASVVLAADYLKQVRQVQGAVLIVATVSTLVGTWEHTIRTTLPWAGVSVVHGGTGKKARLDQLYTPADYYIINYDGVKMIEKELRQLVERGSLSIVVLDELTHYGNHKSGRWKAMDRIVNGTKRAEYVWGLTGSPGSNAPPYFGMCMLVNADNMPCGRADTWDRITRVKYGTERWMWRNSPEASRYMAEAMQPTIRFDKKDIMDLPPVVWQKRECALTEAQQTAYEQMREFMVAEMQSGEVVEAVHKASMIQKLFQISQGCLMNNGEAINLDNENRVEVIDECVKEAEAKVVIFSPYTAVSNRLVDQLRAKGYTVEKVDGSVTGGKRARIFREFQETPDPHVLVCQPRTTAFGVELSAADTIIFNGPPLSGDFIYAQAIERLSSLKQKASQVSIIQLSATREERKFFAGLDSGVKQSDVINDIFVELSK